MRTAARMATTLTLALTLVISPLAGPAQAQTATVTCTGASTITYQPGLTLAPRDVLYTETDDFSMCVSTDPTLTSGSFVASFPFPGASCVAVPGVIEDPGYTIDWNNGQSSTVQLTFTDVIVLGTEQVTGVGPVISGQFTGATATIVWVYPVLNPLQCLTPEGVTVQNGVLAAQLVLAG